LVISLFFQKRLRPEALCMNDIRYVCLSDMHLGEEDSLLPEMIGNNVDPLKASSVMVHLADCLRELISKNEGTEKPTLILNGDILELALRVQHFGHDLRAVHGTCHGQRQGYL
jgi:metallophosphoesterase superfamily enzyme